MSRFSSLAFLPVLTLAALQGCAVVDPFKLSDEAMMAGVAMDVPFGDELGQWLKETVGKNVVVVNMENGSHTDDQAPEYMFHDALVARLVGSKASVMLLERDPDLLSLIGNERADGVRYTVTTTTEPGTSMVERRAAVGKLLRDVVDAIDDQDELIVAPTGPDNAHAIRGGKALETIASNEVGPNKAALIKDLVGQYSDLYKATQTEKREITTSVAGADYLFAYRLYDFGTWSIKDVRYTYIKAHVRVVDMQTGQIVVSDFMEMENEDQLSGKQRRSLTNTHAKQADYARPASRTSDSSAAPSSGGGGASSSSTRRGKLFGGN